MGTETMWDQTKNRIISSAKIAWPDAETEDALARRISQLERMSGERNAALNANAKLAQDIVWLSGKIAELEKALGDMMKVKL